MTGSRFELIIFDLGNTLMYFDGDWPSVMLRASQNMFFALRNSGLDLDEDAFLATFRQRLEEYYLERESEFIEYTTLFVLRTLLAEWGYPNISTEVVRPALNQLYAVTQEHWLPEPDALETLDRLKKEGYRLALISNASDDDDVQVLVDKLGAREYFEAIITSAALGVRKPNPRIFRYLLDLIDVPATRAVMVGDTLGADILGALNAGIFSVWISRRASSPGNQAHSDTIHPDEQIDALGQLFDILAKN